ncbi:MAG: hypothetical protein AAGG44_02710 [Planctomycetota bacterium]
MTKLDPAIQQELEEAVEQAIADVIEEYESSLPLGPDQPTMHCMAKAAVAAYEAAAAQYEDDEEAAATPSESA